MENNQMLKKYYSRLANEGLIKSSLIGLIAGFAVSIIISVVAMTQNYNALLVGFIVAIVIAAILTPILYHIFFKPDLKAIAERIDRLGLEERVITMMELENDSSYIAALQREDAKNKLEAFPQERIRISIAKPMIITLSAVFGCAIVLMLSSMLAVKPKMSWQMLEDKQPEPVAREVDPVFDYTHLNYIAFGGGYIQGDAFQVVVVGEDAEPVIATPFEGYAFVDWVDSGDTEPFRWDRGVTDYVTAAGQFQKKSEDDGDSEEKPDPTQKPEESTEENENEFDPNAILDGKSKYLDHYEAYMQYVLAYLSTGKTLPPELIGLIETYFELLNKGSAEE